MHIVKKIVAVLALFILFQAVYSGELGVDTIEVIDDNIIEVTLSENPNLEVWEIEAEVTILQDINIKGGFTSEISPNQVELLLHDSLKANTNYSLLSVSGADGSIDFRTGDTFIGDTFTNLGSTLEGGIDEIKVIDDTSLIITYSTELVSSVVEYKLLAEKEVERVEKPDYYEPELLISTKKAFEGETDYILMFIELQDVSGTFLEFDTGIYDFQTPKMESLDEVYMEDSVSDETTQSTSEEEIVIVEQEETDPFSEIIGDMVNLVEDEAALEEQENTDDTIPEAIEFEDTFAELPELESAPENTTMNGDIEDVALLAGETPDTGAATWVIVLWTIFINTFFYLSRRKKR